MKRLANWMMAAFLFLAAGMAGAADVPLGAGDVLKISVYGNPDLGLETRVSEAGQITFPLVGAVDIGGLSVSAAEKKLGGLLESGGYLRKAQVNIIVTSLQSQQASVLGQVNRPGRYPLEGKRTVMDMLAMAGGMNPEGADQVSLIRKRAGSTSRSTTASCPRDLKPSALAAALLKSIMRPLMNGPRSLMRTTTSLPVRGLCTSTRVPKGSVLCAAVSSFMSKRSPLAVSRP